MNESRPKPLHIILGVAGVIIAAVLYTVLGSKIGNPPAEAYTPEAYGVEKLEAEAPPAMQIAVWQRNDVNPEHFDRGNHHKTFYDMIELPMEEGATARTITDESFYLSDSEDHTDVAMQILFEGSISGRYELGYNHSLYFSKDNDVMPHYNTSNKAFHNPGGSFSGQDIITISIQDIAGFVFNYEHAAYDGREINNQYIEAYEESGGFSLDDYLTYEKVTDVYDNVPEEYRDCYRAIVTAHLYIYGADPADPSIILSEAVLELKTYTRWIDLPPGLGEQVFDAYKIPRRAFTDVTVVSYTQSDSYALE